MYIYTLKPESVDWIRTYLILNSPTFSNGSKCDSYVIEDKNFYIIRGMFYYLKEDKLHILLPYTQKTQYNYVMDVIKHCIIEEQFSKETFPYFPQYIF